MDSKKRLDFYRRFLYEVGSLPTEKGAAINQEIYEKEKDADFKLTKIGRFRLRTRYFTDSGVLGTKEFVTNCYWRFQHHFTCKHEKKPRPIKGLEGIFSMKKLRENL